MKKIIMGLLLALTTLSAHAQFEQGTSYFSTSLTGLDLNYAKDTNFKLGTDITGGYFLEDGWMLYGRLGYLHQSVKGPSNDTNDLKVGAGMRYYIEQNGLYLNLGLQYERRTFGVNRDFLMVTPEVGYCFYLNHYVSIEPAVYYDCCVNHFSESSRVGLKFGFGFYF